MPQDWPVDAQFHACFVSVPTTAERHSRVTPNDFATPLDFTVHPCYFSIIRYRPRLPAPTSAASGRPCRLSHFREIWSVSDPLERQVTPPGHRIHTAPSYERNISVQFGTHSSEFPRHRRLFTPPIGPIRPRCPLRQSRFEHRAVMDKAAVLGYNMATLFGVPRAAALPTPNRAPTGRGGGIGRHAALRALWPQGCRSSNLLLGTTRATSEAT